MSYTLEIRMRDREGAVTRLLLLISQRHLTISRFSATRSDAGVIAVVEIEGPWDKAPWVVSQLTRHRDVVAVHVVERVRTAGLPSWSEASGQARESYRVHGNSVKNLRTFQLPRSSRLAAAKS